MRHRRTLWVPMWVALTLLLGACASDEPPTDSYELSGVVSDDRSGDPISGALVTFTSDTLYTKQTRTDGDGIYEMVVESDSLFGQVKAEANGYVAGDETVYFDQPRRRIDIALRSAPSEE